jgi:hypothetical protein
MLKKPLTTSLATVAVLAFGAAPALAVDDTKPTPCAGVLVADPAGDQGSGALAIGAGENQDITGIFFTKRNGITSVNLEISNLSKDVPATALAGIDWLVYFTDGEEVGFVRATTSGSDVAYEFGHDDPTQGLTPDGTTAGAFFEGAKGVIQMDLPDKYADKELKNVWAASAMNQIVVVAYADSAPDAQEGPSVTPQACDAGAPAAGGVLPGATTGPTTLPASFPASAGSAKKAQKAKRLRFKIRAAQEITGLKLVLKDSKGKKTFASGSVSKANGVTTVTLKPKAKLKKGLYLLQATGKVDGKTLKVARKIRLSA